MKRSELREMIREEIQKLDESKHDWWKLDLEPNEESILEDAQYELLKLFPKKERKVDEFLYSWIENEEYIDDPYGSRKTSINLIVSRGKQRKLKPL